MISRPKIGICFSDLSPSQNSFFFIMEAAEKYVNSDFIIFYESLARSNLHLPCASMQMVEAWDFTGPLIATNLLTANKILNCPSTKERYFYCWDLEWIRFKQKNYHDLSYIYRNPNLKLITRSEDHKILIEECWNTKVHLVADNWSGILDNEQITKKPKKESFLIHRSRSSIPFRGIL